MSEREEFEKFWRQEMNTEVFDLARTEYAMTSPENQQYLCHETNRGWITWQARAQHVAKIDSAEMLERLNGALRQYRHNNDNTGAVDKPEQSFVFGYDKHEIDGLIADLVKFQGQQSAGTPAARWRENGEPDPHGDKYNGERAGLCKGDMTDDELANAVYLSPGIANLTAAKERIRWLSRLVEKLKGQHGADSGEAQENWKPSIDWAVARCRALSEQGFDRVRLDVLEKNFINAIEAHRPNPPQGEE